MSQFVLDCSVSMAWCLEDEMDDYSDGIFLRLSRDTALVPALWAYETVNVLLAAERRGRIQPDVAARFLDILKQLPIEIVAPTLSDVSSHCLALGRRHLLTAYDAAYLAIALERKLPLATRDEALQRAAREGGVELVAPE